MEPDFFIKGIINVFASSFWTSIKSIWPLIWAYVIGFLIIIIVGIILQIGMLRGTGRNTLSPWFNRLAGSIIYAFFFCIFLALGYWLLGTEVIDIMWFTIIGVLSFMTTWLFLRIIGFWFY